MMRKMKRIFLVIFLTLFLVSLGLAEEDFVNPPQWEVNEKWRYKTREERGRNLWVATGDIWVAGSEEDYYIVNELGILRFHPAILLATTPQEFYGGKIGERIIQILFKELTPIAWRIPGSDPFVSIEGWRLLDWPLSLGKKWQGRSKIRIFDKFLEDNYTAEVSTVGTVAVSAGNFQAVVIVQEGHLSGARSASYKLVAWYAPAVRSFAKITVEFQKVDIKFTMELISSGQL